MPAPSEQNFQSDLAVPLREPIKLSLPLSNQIWQVFARADPATGSTINEYKTSLQLPGSHLGIHLAATHLLVIKHCLMYHESMKLSGVPVQGNHTRTEKNDRHARFLGLAWLPSHLQVHPETSLKASPSVA